MPLWRIEAGRKPVRMKPWDWISYEKQEWFWDDGTTPWRNQARYETELKRLEGFGVSGLPILVETLPYLVLHDDLRIVRDAVDLLRKKYELLQVA